MALSDSMFLFEIIVEDFKKFMRCKEFIIRSQFEDVFTLDLNERNEESWQHERKLIKPKRKIRNTKSNHKSSSKILLQSGHSLLLANNIEWLISHMSLHPLELSIWSKKNPEKKLGGARIPWSKPYKDYLIKLSTNPNLPPVVVNGKYNIINETKSKCMASITLSIKLRHVQGSHVAALSNRIELNHNNTDGNTDTNKSLFTNDKLIGVSHLLQSVPVKNTFTDSGSGNVRLNDKNNDNSLLRIAESDTKLSNHIPETILLKSRSMSSVKVKTEPNPLTYIFGCPKEHFGNRIYCVSYFTVENDVSGSADAPKALNEEIDQPKGRYHFKLCDSQCPMKKENSGSCSQSVCSLDLPEEASHLIRVTKCKQIECDSKQQREPPKAPDDRILLDLTNLNSECCDFTEKIEEVVGGVKGRIQVGDDPCFCTCECTFGFTKKTTYCTVCGGYEIVGEEMAPTVDNQAPFPCPVFHKLIDKNKLKNWSTSGSESKKKGDDQSVRSMKVSSGQKAAATTKRQAQVTKSVESEKDTKKGIKKKKDDRFKFNYGYKGIPPQIGHSECAMPCTGTLSNVPKNMGWLWTAEDIPGMKVKDGWKPGAISKRLLRALNKAKLRRSVIEQKQTKKSKKRVEEKPALIISSKGGEYRIEMNVPPNSNGVQCTPLIYSIESANNKDKIEKKERKQRRLIRAAIDAWSDPYKPGNCQNICLPAYNRAIGVERETVFKDSEVNDKDNDKEVVVMSCSSDEEISSSCSSSDIDWELQFSPPSALRKKVTHESFKT